MVGLRCMELDALLAAGAQQRALRANMGRATRRPVAAARARRRGRAAHRAHSGDGRCRCGRAGGGGRRAAPPSLAPSPPITFIFVTDRTCVSRLFVVTDDVWRHTSCDPLPCTRLRSVRAMGLCVWQRRQFFDRECRRDTEVMRYLIHRQATAVAGATRCKNVMLLCAMPTLQMLPNVGTERTLSRQSQTRRRLPQHLCVMYGAWLKKTCGADHHDGSSQRTKRTPAGGRARHGCAARWRR